MADSQTDNKAGNIDPASTGTEFNSHMTNDGAPGSHSELFGLAKKDGSSDQSSKPEPGSATAPGAGEETDNKPTPAEPEAKTGGMADGTSDNAPPGAGSSVATPSQGTGNVGADK